jgi:hypothetical protein
MKRWREWHRKLSLHPWFTALRLNSISSLVSALMPALLLTAIWLATTTTIINLTTAAVAVVVCAVVRLCGLDERNFLW